jgi:ELWxxDGT repeat protein
VLLSFTPRLLQDINPMGAASSPSNFTSVGRLTFFTADDGTHGVELWKTDGTGAGTQMVLDINYGSSPEYLTNIRGTLFFTADDGTHGRELWESNGSAAGTFLVTDIDPASSASPLYLTNVNGTLFFQANDGTHGQELWESNGAAAGTALVKDIYPGISRYGRPNSSYPKSLTNVNGTLFFQANDGIDGVELWRSDGTAAGTELVQDINPLGASSDPSSLMNVNGTLFFLANDGSHGVQIWTSNGTAAGTQVTLDIPSNENPWYLTNVNGSVFFSAADRTHGRELWETNGSATGTQLVLDINQLSRYPGSSSYPKYLTNVNGTLFFQANDGSHGVELWKSNGSAAGTNLVLDINPGANNSNPKYLTNIAGTLFFWADDGTHGAELWRSDGSASGTELVKDIRPGPGTSYPAYLTNVNGSLFFPAFDGLHGLELWQSNGSAAGTKLVGDIFPGAAGSHPQQLSNIQGALLFSADDGTHGREPWLLPVSTITSSSVRSSVNPSVFGQTVTLIAIVQAQALGAEVPTGTVVFKDGATVLGSATINAVGRATASTSSLAVGGHTITAAYGGDSIFAGDTSSPLKQLVNPDSTLTQVTSAPNPSTFGGTVSFTAKISAQAPGSGAPSGSVTFKEGSTVLAPNVALSGGQAIYATKALAVGPHTITAVYSGSGNFKASQGDDSAGTQVVQKDAASVSVRASVNPSVYGQAVIFTATVASGGPAAGPPTGSVSFLDGSSVLGTASLDSSGRATMSTAALTGGNHSISATYGGDTHFRTAASLFYGQAVRKDNTSLTISSSPNPSVYGQTVTFVAQVKSAGPAAGPPTGSVIFKDGATVLSNKALNSSGVATFTTNLLSSGFHTLTAIYSGDKNFSTSQGNDAAIPQSVKKDATTTSVRASPNPSIFGDPVTFTATVHVMPPGSVVAKGVVTFKDGTTQLGTGALNAAGVATFSTAALSVGNHSITAQYPGTNNFTGSVSPVFGQGVHATGLAGLVPTRAGPMDAPQWAPARLSMSAAPVSRIGGVPDAPLNAARVDGFFAMTRRRVSWSRGKPQGLVFTDEWVGWSA